VLCSRIRDQKGTKSIQKQTNNTHEFESETNSSSSFQLGDTPGLINSRIRTTNQGRSIRQQNDCSRPSSAHVHAPGATVLPAVLCIMLRASMPRLRKNGFSILSLAMKSLVLNRISARCTTGEGLVSKWIRRHKLEGAIETQGIFVRINLLMHP
jgi:hypothetical protein